MQLTPCAPQCMFIIHFCLRSGWIGDRNEVGENQEELRNKETEQTAEGAELPGRVLNGPLFVHYIAIYRKRCAFTLEFSLALIQSLYLSIYF